MTISSGVFIFIRQIRKDIKLDYDMGRKKNNSKFDERLEFEYMLVQTTNKQK